MNFRIADTFTDSLGNLTGDEQKAVKTTAFDLQMNPANPGMQFHKLDRAKDKNFWSVRVSGDIRLIVHRTDKSLMLCYVDHHDKAYQWAERRKIERHPKTGAAQLVEIRETVKEISVPKYVEAEEIAQPAKAEAEAMPLFADVPDDELLTYGVPEEWMDDVRQATEESLFDVAEHLPHEAAEALLELATGGTPIPQPTRPGRAVATPVISSSLRTKPTPRSKPLDPFEHPDAKRRFRVISNVEELARALEYPWEKWAVFLHPAQRDLVERDYNGPARVSGSAGTGKTIVALHRAVHLARQNPDARVLLATFSNTLANALRHRLRRLISNEPKIAERLEVHSMGSVARRLYESHFGTPSIATENDVRAILREVAENVGEHKFRDHFLWAEWDGVVDAWQLTSWEDYRDVRRLGRKTRLAEPQRKILWSVYEHLRERLAERGWLTRDEMFSQLTEKIGSLRNPPFEFAVIDEAQDISVAELRFLAALGGERPNSMFFAGDLGQRIFRQPFSWLALGVDIRGRSHTLRINYRTSHQIRAQADRLLGPELSDVDGVVEDRRGTISVFDGVEPKVLVFDSTEAEVAAVAAWIRALFDEGYEPHEIGLFVRSRAQLERARAVVDAVGVPSVELDENVETTVGKMSTSTMHLAKGLEFRAVAVMACDDEVIPLQERIEGISDASDLEDVYNTERHLLYVACTRARDRLLVTCTDPPSEFLDDMSDQK